MLTEKKQISLKKFKKQLKSIQKQNFEGLKVQESSTKLLKFLVNDILDFGQIKAGKFRKNITYFNSREAISEIIMILKFKAEQYGIKLGMKFVNFPSKEIRDPADREKVIQKKDFMISCDS